MRAVTAFGSLVLVCVVFGCGQSSRSTKRAADAGEGSGDSAGVGADAGAGADAGGSAGVSSGGTGIGGSGNASGNGGAGRGGSAGMGGDGGAAGGGPECEERTTDTCAPGCPTCFTLGDRYSVCGTNEQPA